LLGIGLIPLTPYQHTTGTRYGIRSQLSPAVCADAFSDLCFCLEKDGVTRSSKFKAPTTVARYRRACAQMFGFVVDRELLAKNPFPTAKPGKKTIIESGTTEIQLNLLPTHE